MRAGAILVLLFCGVSCGPRRALPTDESDPSMLDSGLLTSTGLSLPTSFTCSGPPQLELDGEPQPIDHIRNEAAVDLKGQRWTHLDWYLTEYGGYGIMIRLDGLDHNRRIDIRRSGRFKWLHQFVDGKFHRGKVKGLGPATMSWKDPDISGTLAIEGDDRRTVVEVCLEVRLSKTWTSGGSTLLRMYLRGETD